MAYIEFVDFYFAAKSAEVVKAKNEQKDVKVKKTASKKGSNFFSS